VSAAEVPSTEMVAGAENSRLDTAKSYTLRWVSTT
jgi:hypothetical protein